MRKTISNLAESTKEMVDFAALGATVGVLLNWLPQIVALLTVLWLLMRIYEHLRWIYRGRIREEKP